MDNYLKLSHDDQDKLLDAQRSSGQTVRSFCQDHGIKESRFYSWRTRRNRRQNSKEQAGFTQLQPTAPRQLSVRLRGGLCQ
jgi:transposase-like protein